MGKDLCPEQIALGFDILQLSHGLDEKIIPAQYQDDKSDDYDDNQGQDILPGR